MFRQALFSSKPHVHLEFRTIRGAMHPKRGATYPPLKAPTGFLIGAAATTSALRTALVWKLRAGAAMRDADRTAGAKNRDAMVAPMAGMKLYTNGPCAKTLGAGSEEASRAC